MEAFTLKWWLEMLFNARSNSNYSYRKLLDNVYTNDFKKWDKTHKQNKCLEYWIYYRILKKYSE